MKHNYAFAELIYDFSIMGHEHDGGTKLIYFFKDIDNFLRIDRIKISRRFIGNQNFWTMHK